MFLFFSFLCFMVVGVKGANCVVFPVVSHLPPILPTKFVSIEKTPVGDFRCCIVGYCSGMFILVSFVSYS